MILFHPSTATWLHSIDYGATASDAPWQPGETDILYNRYISAINQKEQKLQLDVPVYDHLNRALAPSSIFILNEPGIKRNIGIESLRIEIETAGNQDERHVRNAIKVFGVEDCWIKNITALHFSLAAIYTNVASRVTIENCEALDPHSLLTGGRRYNFLVGQKSNNILFKDCHSSRARHAYVSNGNSSVSGIVFLNCTAEYDFSGSESHQRWSQALLYDNVVFSNPRSGNLLGLGNRGDFGTGHGWAAVHSVAWNVRMPAYHSIYIQKPPGRQNYALGCMGNVTGKGFFQQPEGHIELSNEGGVTPSSLYLAQLEERLSSKIKPDPPARLQAWLNSENNTVELSWLDIAGDEEGYRVEYSLDSGQIFTKIAILAPNSTVFLHQAPIPLNNTILYRVSSFNQNCQSAYSNPAKIDNISVTPNIKSAIFNLTLYPNPTTEWLYLQVSEKAIRLNIYNSIGQKVTALSTLDQKPVKIDIRHLLPGSYFLILTTNKGQRAGTFIVNRD